MINLSKYKLPFDYIAKNNKRYKMMSFDKKIQLYIDENGNEYNETGKWCQYSTNGMFDIIEVIGEYKSDKDCEMTSEKLVSFINLSKYKLPFEYVCNFGNYKMTKFDKYKNVYIDEFGYEYNENGKWTGFDKKGLIPGVDPESKTFDIIDVIGEYKDNEDCEMTPEKLISLYQKSGNNSYVYDWIVENFSQYRKDMEKYINSLQQINFDIDEETFINIAKAANLANVSIEAYIMMICIEHLEKNNV